MSSRTQEDWRPNASLAALQQRAQLLATIRTFFSARNVMEVETPILAHSTNPDPAIESLCCTLHTDESRTAYLQTSPEFAMKRLLAAGSGSIYQISKAFRDKEIGRYHNPEFTLLEWYRPGFDDAALRDEVAALITTILGSPSAHCRSYQELFLHYVDCDPLTATPAQLQRCISNAGIETIGMAPLDRDALLTVLWSHCIEPHLGFDAPLFVTEFPASQAALARLDPERPEVAQRFELYIAGVELANGFHELTDATEQRQRFIAQQQQRLAANQACPPLDEAFLAALEHGLPACAGVALGIDRLLMLQLGCHSLDQVLSFA